MASIDESKLAHVVVELAYTMPEDGPARVRVFPPASGREIERPPRERIPMPIFDCRPIADQLNLDEAGFELVSHRSAFSDFYDSDRVRAEYYPEVEDLLQAATGALRVIVFDHNVRNQPRSDRKEVGVREPVDGAHNDYTVSSGPRRVREILKENDSMDLAGHRAALINVWRPIAGPVQDRPLAICDARSAKLEDFIPTEIQHFLEDDLETPHLIGQIYSFRHNPDHKWFYVSNMRPGEVMLLKCYDSANDGRACFTGHTGFINPDCPDEFIPRESIEARTVAIFS